MEGLIPFVYKSLKKNRTRRKYECLSSGASAAYNIADFYVKDDHVHEYISRGTTPGLDNITGSGGPHHRRYNSMVVDDRCAGGFALDGGAPPPPKPKQLVRFRSHKMLSCITGA